MISALQQMKRGRDQQTIDNYRAAYTQYANMAQQDLAKAFPIYRTDTVELEEGGFDVSLLPRWCTKIISVRQKKPLMFLLAEETGLISCWDKKGKAEGEVQVRYRCLPNPVENSTDIPELPEQLHQCIVSYVVACDRSEGDASTQGGASVYFQMYNEQKRNLMRGGLGAPETYKIENMRNW